MSAKDRKSSLDLEQLELLAAYLDGAVTDDERRRVEGLLARSEAAREVVAESVMALDAGGNGEREPVRSVRPSRMTRWRVLVPLAAAAAALVLFWPNGGNLATGDWADRLGARGGGAPLVLPVVRGEQDGLVGAATRAGVRWVDARIALAAGNPTRADSLLHALAADLRTLEGSGPIVARVEALVGGASVDEFDDAEGALGNHLGNVFRRGILLEALRTSAAMEEAELASSLLHHSLMDDVIEGRPETSPLREARDRTAGTPDWAAVEREVEEILRNAAG